MKGFEDVTLGWDGKEYVVPANKQLLLIATIEDVFAGASGRQALEVLCRGSGPSYSTLARAYGAALRYAGADVSDDEVYLTIMSGMANAKGETAILIQSAIVGLISIIAPPIGHMLSSGDSDAEPLKPAKKKKAAA